MSVEPGAKTVPPRVGPARYRPISWVALRQQLADRLAATRPGHPLRVLVDGAPATAPHQLADELVEPLRERGRPVLRLDARWFWQPASLRLEWGHRDAQAYYEHWLDAATLRREVLAPLGPGGDQHWLPSLRDPVTDRSTRAVRERAAAEAVLVVSGSLLLAHDLPADVVVHLSASAPALARRTPPAQAWTLPAFRRYETDVDPVSGSDIVIRVEDPAHPAVAISR